MAARAAPLGLLFVIALLAGSSNATRVVLQEEAETSEAAAVAAVPDAEPVALTLVKAQHRPALNVDAPPAATMSPDAAPEPGTATSTAGAVAAFPFKWGLVGATGCDAGCRTAYGTTGVVINGGTANQALCQVEVKVGQKYFEYSGVERVSNGQRACTWSDGSSSWYRNALTRAYYCGCTTTACGASVTACNTYFWGFTGCSCTTGCVCRVPINTSKGVVYFMGWSQYKSTRCEFYFPGDSKYPGVLGSVWATSNSLFYYCLPKAPVVL